ncbi:hypothetical protein IW492_14140 [Enterococcus sp. BWB1-3]|uniref:hypothetical protein n=1 Tax=Enterococcus sp. BWB1-3 TaxID=2787713 RepID=UPI00192120E2|nr:hypothetical protein [Enterococcus sp. BWB1-3]MBL1230372.1 hypothetical protein [Enterococcus sp. BWB1-3]
MIKITVSVDLLKEKLDSYFSNNITKEQLGIWAKEEYYKVLTGEYLYIDKLVIHKFLKKISEFHIKEDDRKDEYPATEEEIWDIYSIINGEKDISFYGSIRILQRYLEKFLSKEEISKISKIKESILKNSNDYHKQKVCLCLQQINEIFDQKCIQPTTIIEMLRVFIVDMINNMMTKSVIDVSSSSFGLYLRPEDRTDQKNINKILKLISCILGEEAFEICIIYNNGCPNISFLI